MRVLVVRRELVTDITLKDAIASGYRTRAEFFEHWSESYRADELACSWPCRVWVVSFEVAAAPPRYLTRGRGSDGRGYTSQKSRAIDQLEVVPDHYLRTLSKWAPPGEQQAPARKPSIADDAERLICEQLRDRHTGRDAEDVYALTNGRLGTVGEIRQRRREMGLRAVDGFSEQEMLAIFVRQGLVSTEASSLSEVADVMLMRGCSTRDLARVLDCSVGKAHSLIAERRQERAA